MSSTLQVCRPETEARFFQKQSLHKRTLSWSPSCAPLRLHSGPDSHYPVCAFTDRANCRNPNDLKRTPGGSSSGSGAVVAACIRDRSARRSYRTYAVCRRCGERRIIWPADWRYRAGQANHICLARQNKKIGEEQTEGQRACSRCKSYRKT